MDLTTTYMGLNLRCPVVASAGPIQRNIDGVKALADAGVGAITMFSLFEEQIRSEQARRVALEVEYDDMTTEALSYFPDVPAKASSDGLGEAGAYLKLVEEAAASVEIPVIASLNGSTRGGWTSIAKQMEDAGASGIELNIYYVPNDGTLTALEVENLHIDIVGAVKAKVSIPVAVKLSPYFSSFAAFAPRLVEAGADALVMFNRFFQPDIDIEEMELAPGVELSRPFDSHLPRTWIATMRNRLACSLAASSGVETVTEIVKYLVSGADIVCTTSSLVRHGPGYAHDLIEALDLWLEHHGFGSVHEIRGIMTLPSTVSPQDFERQEYFRALNKANGGYASLANL